MEERKRRRTHVTVSFAALEDIQRDAVRLAKGLVNSSIVAAPWVDRLEWVGLVHSEHRMNGIASVGRQRQGRRLPRAFLFVESAIEDLVRLVRGQRSPKASRTWGERVSSILGARLADVAVPVRMSQPSLFSPTIYVLLLIKRVRRSTSGNNRRRLY
ncbi:hypothetical protein K458DRAFT_428288 [Lentithecium fluviatile CBS 122367]|uniref:Uncharacterized protein n=1 Tax=Lentithecium fluviatile CBS 122367 TaxID=1168545 RepID=A0A6G1JE84_9PLEO|nr:hypothetical protein K458DRAFT_428288 [Lentithecium fluviatile CBS 122367]